MAPRRLPPTPPDLPADVVVTVGAPFPGYAVRLHPLPGCSLSLLTRRDVAADPTRTNALVGLAICRRLVEVHGGTIDVESVVGSGSVFTVRQPRSGGPS